MKVLVTGSAGLVGSACVELFKKDGWEVVGVDNNARAERLGTEDRTDKIDTFLDFTSSMDVFRLFNKHKFDAVIHAGAQPSHDWANTHVFEDFNTNAYGTLVLLEATRKFAPHAGFVFVSTDKVYGENMVRELEEKSTRYHSDKPFDETLGLDFAGHRSPFGCSKVSADIYAQEYANTFGLGVGIFRPGCITGKNHAGAELHGFLAYLAKCIRDGKPYRIFGNGKQVRDQIHANDLAEAFLAFIKNHKKGAVYNIGGGADRSISVIEAISAFEKRTGKTCDYSFHPARMGDRQWDVHDVSAFRRDYPEWEYRYSLDNILDDLVNFA